MLTDDSFGAKTCLCYSVAYMSRQTLVQVYFYPVVFNFSGSSAVSEWVSAVFGSGISSSWRRLRPV